MKDLRIPAELLRQSSTMMWVYAHLLVLADEDGRASIRVNSWCKSIGLSRQKVRSAINELSNLKLITKPTTNTQPSNTTEVYIYDKAACKPTKKPRQPSANQPPQPATTPESSSNALIISSRMPYWVSPMLAPAFTMWLEYKASELKERYKTERTLKAAYDQLVRLSDNDPDTALRIVEQSMANRWKGLFKLKDNGTTTTTFRTTADQRAAERERLAGRLQQVLGAIGGS